MERMGSARASKDAAMQQIRSETQRLLRESEISLPYHRPKQRTLQEFLNRKKVGNVLPEAHSTAQKVKRFSGIISKAVEEKEKEAEKFYKSSDSEEEEDEEEKKEEEGNKEVDLSKLPNNDLTGNDREKILNFDVDVIKVPNENNENEINNTKNAISDKSSSKIKEQVSRKLFINDSENEKENCDKNDSDTIATNSNLNIVDAESENIIETTSVKTTDPSAASKTGTIESVKSPEVTDSIMDNLIIPEKDTSIIVDQPQAGEINDEFTNLETENDFVLYLSDENDSECDTEAPETGTIDMDIPNEQSHPDDSQNPNVEEVGVLKLSAGKQVNNISVSKDNNDIIDTNPMNEDFGLPPPEFDDDRPTEDKSVKALKKKILSMAANTKLRSCGTPGSTIDLTIDVKPTVAGVNKLLDRYVIRHTAVRKPVEEKNSIKTTGDEEIPEGTNLVDDIIPYTLPNNSENDDKCKPGEKLVRMKEGLREIMINKRNAEWKQKEKDAKLDNEDIENEEKDILDDEEYLDDDEMEGSTESEPEEDDIEIIDKPKKKCIYGDEEAEESDAEENLELNEEECIYEDDENIDSEEDEDEENGSEDEGEHSSDEEISKPRKLKRIIKPFDEDSNESVENDANKVTVPEKSCLKRTDTDVDLFASQNDNSNSASDTETGIPAFQQCRTSWPDAMNQTPLPKEKSILELVSPVTQLTALNTSLDSTKMLSLDKSTFDDSYFREDTPANKKVKCMGNLNKWVSLQKKLFDDPPEKVDDQELMDLCSGKFNTSTGNKNGLSQLVDQSAQKPVTDSQLLSICSGAFTTPAPNNSNFDDSSKSGKNNRQGISQLMNSRPQVPVTDSQLLDICSGSFNTQQERKTDNGNVQFKVTENVNVQDLISKKIMPATVQSGFSKLMNEGTQKSVSRSEIMGVCSGSFDSTQVKEKKTENDNLQIDNEESHDINLMFDDESSGSPKIDNIEKIETNKSTAKTKEPSNVPWSSFQIASSSEEEHKEKDLSNKRKKKLTKKKVKKLVLSDDEDNTNKDSASEKKESESESEDDENEETYIDYDSEENEVIVTKKEVKKTAKNFLEYEAELSGSDWDSADEDERNLNKFEHEEADDEDIDEEHMKNELDRIHVKQVMADDQREVRMLQDLLFEDGDLHSDGAGRERKFKWKNYNYGDDKDLPPREDDCDDAIDEFDAAQELEMRKMRHEQQKFLEERLKTTNEIEENLESSEIFKVGLKVSSFRSNSQIVEKKEVAVSVNHVKRDAKKRAAPNIISSLMSKSSIRSSQASTSTNLYRGSFLARGESTLIRIAQNIREEKSVKPLRPGNFVFEHISPSVPVHEAESDTENNETSDSKAKRKRKPNAGTTPNTSKKQKVEEHKRGKKLF